MFLTSPVLSIYVFLFSVSLFKETLKHRFNIEFPRGRLLEGQEVRAAIRALSEVRLALRAARVCSELLRKLSKAGPP